MTDEFVILVDQSDMEIGTMEKMETHRKGLLHRAISVFILNAKGEWLLQRRALNKYHSNGLWTNTCCSHPFPNETNLQAAHRRLNEEMGMECDLREVFHFIYKEKLDNDLTEHELDHVFVGFSESEPQINTNEVMEWARISFDEIKAGIELYPELYTVWFKAIYERVNEQLAFEV